MQNDLSADQEIAVFCDAECMGEELLVVLEDETLCFQKTRDEFGIWLTRVVAPEDVAAKHRGQGYGQVKIRGCVARAHAEFSWEWQVELQAGGTCRGEIAIALEEGDEIPPFMLAEVIHPAKLWANQVEHGFASHGKCCD